MRFPNGYGGIINLGKGRRKPFAVRVTIGSYDDGRQIQKYIGYYEKRKDAVTALAKYNMNPNSFDLEKSTFAEVFLLFWKNKFDFEYDADAKRNSSNEGAYASAYNNSEILHDRIYSQLNKNDFQNVIDKAVEDGLKDSSIQNLKKLWNGMYKISLEKDSRQEGFKYVSTPDFEDSNKHVPFDKDELKKIFAHTGNNEYYDTILCLLYTGTRISELLGIEKKNVHLNERYFVGGMKTSAGKDRIIPIHKEIVPTIKKWMDKPGKFLFCKEGKKIIYSWYRSYVWNIFFKELNILGHTPHDARHTFISQAEKCNLKPLLIKRIAGHASNDLTKDVYTHSSTDELINAIDLFRYDVTCL